MLSHGTIFTAGVAILFSSTLNVSIIYRDSEGQDSHGEG